MQLLLKNLICSLYDNGLINVTYFTLQIIAVVTSHISAGIFGKEMGIGAKRAVIAVAMEVAAVYAEMALIRVLIKYIVPEYIPVMNSYYNNVGRTFILVPISAWVVSKLRKENFQQLCGLYAFAQPMIWGLGSVGCLISGCCHGYPWQWGIYSIDSQTYLFPTQLLNAVGLVSIACFIRSRIKKQNYKTDGREYPVALMLIGSLRFATEFLMDNSKIVFGLSSLSFDSIVMFASGLIALIIIRKKRKLTQCGSQQ